MNPRLLRDVRWLITRHVIERELILEFGRRVGVSPYEQLWILRQLGLAVARVTDGSGYQGTPVGNNDFANFLNATGADAILFFTACPGQTGAFTLTWDQGGTNQSVTAIGSPFDANGGTGRVHLYGLVAPTAGLKTLRVASVGTPQEIFVGGIAVSGANQTGGTTTFANRADNRAAAASPTNQSSVTISSAVGDMTVDISSGPEVMTITGAAGTTQIFVNNSGGVTSAGASYKAGSASNTHQWGFANPIQWVSSGLSIVAAGAAGGDLNVLIGEPITGSSLLN